MFQFEIYYGALLDTFMFRLLFFALCVCVWEGSTGIKGTSHILTCGHSRCTKDCTQIPRMWWALVAHKGLYFAIAGGLGLLYQGLHPVTTALCGLFALAARSGLYQIYFSPFLRQSPRTDVVLNLVLDRDEDLDSTR